MKMKKNLIGYGIGFLIIGICVIGIWWWKNIDHIEPVYRWFQNMSEEDFQDVSFEYHRLRTEDRTKLIQLLHSIPKKNIKLAKVQGDMGNGSDYWIDIKIDNKEYQLLHTYIVMADVMIKYKGYDYWIKSEELRNFLEDVNDYYKK